MVKPGEQLLAAVADGDIGHAWAVDVGRQHQLVDPGLVDDALEEGRGITQIVSLLQFHGWHQLLSGGLGSHAEFVEAWRNR